MGKRILRTRLCDMLGIDYPIVCAGMGPVLIGEQAGSPVDLVVAVSEAGGLGVLGGSGFTVDELRQAIREIRSKTGRPFGVDLLLPRNVVEGKPVDYGTVTEVPLGAALATLPKPYQEWIEKVRCELGLPDADLTVRLNTTTMRPLDAVKVCIEERIPLFCAGLGNPGFMTADAHAKGIKVLGITGNVKNARRMAATGLDLLVAQGFEGGGHTGRVGTMALLPGVLDAAGDIPVLAAGGIGDGRGLAAALAMGCVGVWVGTRFLATVEGGALPVNKQRIVSSSDEDTRVSYAITGKTSRTSYSRFHDLWNESGLDPLPFPMQVLVSSALMGSFVAAGRDDYVGGFAGQVSGIIHEIKPAAEVVEEMVEEAADIITRRLWASVQVR
ncbi:MAG TPA: nitronate monooxygenase [Deltaproteobacteria bacterium]|nr:nitronate monooxygenase [Deltaproteobacteria bacterium]HRW81239.1 nitronate monooxygenase [Desulfomonilia bacterium]HNQ86818.1 nitronate monooxygenase [Deltaproteobacteria bacterium]HNS91024.1 nitronate monooxygenase [Deltaproteobacteria bacterium]HOA45801.1 nitronate monooxygenase [Deltaproteobacteria bacterium]